MSQATDEGFKRDDPLLYAPKRVRALLQDLDPKAERDEETLFDRELQGEFDIDQAQDELQLPSFLETPAEHDPLPRELTESESSQSRHRKRAIIASVSVALSCLAIGAGLAALRSGQENSARLGSLLGEQTRHERLAGSTKLVLQSPRPKHMGETAPLAVSVAEPELGGLIVIRGLMPNGLVSVGRGIEDGSWWLSAGELENAAIQPPPQFVGAVDVTIELRAQNGGLSDQRTLRFEWLDDQARVSKTTSVSFEAPRKLSDESEAMSKRARELLASGDVAAARLVLKRAAEGGSAEAAMSLANTYDPLVLQGMHVRGCAPDVAMAKHWYERAQEMGARDARERIKMLAKGREE
jgi:hypothetical protein